MKVCSNCFSDKELKAFIISTYNIGKCDVCNSKNIPVLLIDELLDFFQELFDNFKKARAGDSLKAKIQGSWNFFSSHKVATKILNNVIPLISTKILNAEDLVEYSEDIISNVSYWEVLKDEFI